MRVVVTRPMPAAAATARRLAGLGHVPVLAPLLAVEPTGATVPEGPFAAIAATSANAFLGFAKTGLPADLAGLTLHAVGERTAAAGRAAGFRNVVAGGGDATALADHLARHVPAGSRVLYLAGVQRKPDLEARLRAAGLEVAVAEVYAAGAGEPAALPVEIFDGTEPTAVLHYSRRSAEAFVAAGREGGHEAAMVGLPHLCLSHDVAEPLRAAGARIVTVARQPDEEALLARLADVVG